MAPHPPSRPGNPVAWILALLLIAGILAVTVPGILSSRRAANERAASAALKTLSSAEADFRANDRDANRIQDFWTGDVSGLFDTLPQGSAEPIRLIEAAVAAADPSRPGATPYHGYWFVAMDLDEDGKLYREGPPQDRHPSKFAFCAYPASRGSGNFMFIINENNTIFKEPFTGEPRRRWPTDAELKSRYPKGS